MKKITKIITVITVFALMFTSLPTMGGSIDAHAAGVAAPAQVKNLKATNITHTSVKLTWTKIAKNRNTKGYAIYRNGKLIKRVSFKTNTFTNTKLKAGTKYKFTVRAYNTYKQKQYYNSKTKKWQAKKPTTKQWKGKKTRTVTAYKYGKVSATRNVTTKKIVKKTTTKPVASKNNTSSSNGKSKNSSTTTSNTNKSSNTNNNAKPSTEATSSNTSAGSNIKKVAYKTFSFIGSTPTTIDAKEDKTIRVQLPANNFGVNWKSSNSSIVSIYSSWQDQVTIRAASENGTATITGTLNVPSGESYSGVRSVSFTIKNTDNGIDTQYGRIYPNPDGSFNVAQEQKVDGVWGAYTNGVYINGVLAPFDVIYKEFPSGSVIRLNAADMKRASYATMGGSPFEYQNGWATWDYTFSSSDESKLYVMPNYRYESKTEPANWGGYPDVCGGAGWGLYFVSAGTARLSVSNGKTFTFIISGKNDWAYNYVSLVKGWNSRVSGKSNKDKVKSAVEYIANTYGYSTVNVHNAFQMVNVGHGDCWAGNSLLYVLCEEMGLPVKYRNAKDDIGAGSGHRNCMVEIDGVWYIADATPDYENSSRDNEVTNGKNGLLMPWDKYESRYVR